MAEAQHFVATGGAAGGELPAGMTGLYAGKAIGDMVLKPKARLLLFGAGSFVDAAQPTKGHIADATLLHASALQSAKASTGAKGGGAGAKRGGGGGGGGVSRRLRVARYLGLLPPAGDGLQPLPILPPA